MFGGGGMNPRKMKQMMEQMGIDVTELDAEEVVIRTGEEELVFSDAQVTRMDAQGQQTYQVVGDPETRAASAGAVESGESDESDESDESEAASDDGGSDAAIPDSDVELVAQRAGVSEAEAREALETTGGDLAAAIDRLE
jgi:nascent polypeptide-associated complex subunit alpha